MTFVIRPENQDFMILSILACSVMVLLFFSLRNHNYYPIFFYMVFLYPYALMLSRRAIDTFNKWYYFRRLRHQICHKVLYKDVWCVEKQISEDCTICLEMFDPAEEIVMLPCGCFQPYHPKCIMSWLEKKASCPLCRKDLLNK
jgi:hypothetical protein